MACRWQPGMKITALLDVLNSALAEPFALAWSQDSPRFLLVLTVVYAVAVIVAVTDQKNTRPGAEHGSAAWGDVFRLNKFYMDKRGPNLLLTQHFHIGIDGYKHKHNTNILIVGGSGAGKTRTYGVPNVLECACSMVITDPKSEILRKTGNLLKQKGYEVLVFDLINPAASFCYNPFVYVHDDREVLTLIENLIQNTTPSHSKSSDPFWEKSETALLQALMLYLLHEAPPEEQNFSMVMEMIAAAEVHEDDDNYQSPLDILFERLEMRDPDSIACKQYRIFKQAAGKTAKSILVSVGVRLAAFNGRLSARRSGRNEAYHTKNSEVYMKLNHNKKSVKISLNLFALYAVMVCGIVFALPAFAADDPLVVVENLSTFIFSLIRAVGLILLGWGIVQVGLSLQSHDPSQRSQGFLTLAGGLVITFAKEILDLITA